MTDEQFDERIRNAYARVELSAEAEDRMLANLLAAESSQKQDGKGAAPARPARRRGSWRWVAPASIAAVLLIGVFVAAQLRPSYNADSAAPAAGAESAAELEVQATTYAEAKDAENDELAEPEGNARAFDADAAAPTSEELLDQTDSADDSYDAGGTLDAQQAEVVVLEDGRRFAIVDLYVPEELDPGELDWQPATLEATGDPCDAALLDDGTCLVLFEGEGDIFLAQEL